MGEGLGGGTLPTSTSPPYPNSSDGPGQGLCSARAQKLVTARVEDIKYREQVPLRRKQKLPPPPVHRLRVPARRGSAYHPAPLAPTFDSLPITSPPSTCSA